MPSSILELNEGARPFDWTKSHIHQKRLQAKSADQLAATFKERLDGVERGHNNAYMGTKFRNVN